VADKDQQYYDEIRRRITKRYEGRAQFFGHLVTFMVINALLWIGLQPDGFWETVLIAFSGLWFVGLAIHGVNFLLAEMRERAIEKAIERERLFHDDTRLEKSKRKRDATARLSLDGELLDVVDDDWESEAAANLKQT